METWNLFLDDVRDVSYTWYDGKVYKLARSMADAIALIKTYGMPAHIAFDHDLGWEDLLPIEGSFLISAPPVGKEAPSGYDFAKWLVDQDLEGAISIPETFTWSIHSSNPAGAANIDAYLKSYMKVKYGN